jgi:hypothetical protein
MMSAELTDAMAVLAALLSLQWTEIDGRVSLQVKVRIPCTYILMCLDEDSSELARMVIVRTWEKMTRIYSRIGWHDGAVESTA